VEIPAPPQVRCAEHGSLAVLIQTPRGQVRYVSVDQQAPTARHEEMATDH
jgi:hypothetical protein